MYVAESEEKANIQETMNCIVATTAAQAQRVETRIEVEEEPEEDFKVYAGTDSPTIKNRGLVLGDS